jgi:hypothetical protein
MNLLQTRFVIMNKHEEIIATISERSVLFEALNLTLLENSVESFGVEKIITVIDRDYKILEIVIGLPATPTTEAILDYGISRAILGNTKAYNLEIYFVVEEL